MIVSADKEFIFPEGSVTPSCHASTVLPLENGEVLAAWFGGTQEKDPDVEIYVARRSVQGEWSKPEAVSEKDNIAHWNPVLYQRKNGEIVLFFKYGPQIETWKTKFICSMDGGKTWSKPQELVPGDEGGRGPVKNKCLLLSDGTLLAPASTETDGWYAFIDRSEDDGITWSRTPNLRMPKYKGEGVGLIQPTLWESKPGKVHCFMRSDAGAVYRSDSCDYGKTWSKPRRTAVPNNNSGIDCTADAAGRLWLIYNPVGKNWGNRYPLCLACSADNGKTFQTVLGCELREGEYSYPAIVCKGNKLHICYTYNRRQIVYREIVLEED